MAHLQTGPTLGNVPIFRGIPLEQIQQLALSARPVKYEPGEVIFHFGDAGDSMFIVTSGNVRILLPSEAGRDVILSDLRSGDSFGEIALLDGQGRSAEAIAMTTTTALVVTRQSLLSVLTQSPGALLNMIGLLCRRIREADERMAEIAFMPLETRLARTLVKHSEGPLQNGRWKVGLSQNELAQMIVASREAVNRQLAIWQRQRVLEVSPQGILLIRREVLERTGHGWDDRGA